jgi:hypothetical protein
VQIDKYEDIFGSNMLLNSFKFTQSACVCRDRIEIGSEYVFTKINQIESSDDPTITNLFVNRYCFHEKENFFEREAKKRILGEKRKRRRRGTPDESHCIFSSLS